MDIGVAVLAHESLADVQKAVASIKANTRTPHLLMVFDNTENDRIGEWARSHAGDVLYVRSPYNVGCARGRNRIAEILAARGCEFVVILDQDVRAGPPEKAGGDWLARMRAVFARHAKTGVVTWELANKTMGPRYKPDATGAIPEAPGMCCMYSLACIKAVGGWDARMLMYRFDTMFCLKADQLHGLKVRVVPGADGVSHDHPHRGVLAYRFYGRERSRSQTIFVAECKQCGVKIPSSL